MCLLVRSPKISVHIQWVTSSQELLVHTHATKNCFIVVWLLGTKHGFTIGTTKQIGIHAVEGRESPHIYTNL